jgi:HD-GYP domain-containing protein (c-di-GMP phosphodiesterase class II)
MKIKRIKIDLNQLKPNSSFAYPLYSLEGEKIIDQGTVMTPDFISKVKLKHGSIIFFSDSAVMSPIQQFRANDALSVSIELMEEISKRQKLTRTTFDTAVKVAEGIADDLSSSLNIDEIDLLKGNSFEDYVFYHSVNVSILSGLFALKLRIFSQSDIKSLVLGAFLHDIGERMMDRQFLNKAGSLNISEVQKLKRHPQLGYELVKSVERSNPIILQSILFHHERYNNRGYYELPYENLPVYSKVLSVCDVFDALTSRRPFRKEPFTARNALKFIINSSESHFDYKLINDFINLMGPILNTSQSFYNYNEICELSSGELAMVKGFWKNDIMKPGVTVFCRFVREGKNTIVKFYEKPFEVNLEDDSERRIRKILNNQNQINSIMKRLEERNLL